MMHERLPDSTQRRLLPRQADNTYYGSKLALWLFGLLVFMKVAMGFNSIVNGHSVASSADGIPLDTFTPAGAQTVVSLFALSGLRQLIICLLGILVLVRYRVRTGTPPGAIVNLVLLALMVIGLALSLWSHQSTRT
jgi:hypothetical protein